MALCRKTPNRAFEHSLDQLTTLADLQKTIIRERYVPLLDEFSQRCLYFAIVFHTCRMIITVGSLIVPALLSIQYTNSSPGTSADSTEFSYRIYWTTWVISLLVTTSNGILTLFKIDKKYFSLHTTLEQLRSEGWQYLQLSGRYSGFHTPSFDPSHTNQFLYFCHAVEKIKMKQVEEEYFKINETNTPSTQGATAPIMPTIPIGPDPSKTPLLPDGLIPPTPLNAVLRQLITSINGTDTSGESKGSIQEEKIVSKEVSS